MLSDRQVAIIALALTVSAVTYPLISSRDTARPPISRPAPQKPPPSEPLTTLTPPPLPREFRGAWIASVGNIDWPSKPELTVAEQQAELLGLLDRAASLKLNAIILQVRPSCDALYNSKLEPWSQYLTGAMGKAPVPYYDPLEFAVTEAHKRGLELHAWFNPFRALTSMRNADRACAMHITRTKPELVRRYGDLMWLDPGEPEARAYTLDVILDVVRRYDIDAVHIDDYFYPYVQKDKRGKPIPFPDDASWQRYVDGGGQLLRDDWRRENINGFVRDLYARIKAEKRWVRFGISPFGIWRPQKDLSIQGLDAFAELYADSRKWLENGWLDYISPQLYWSIDAPKQSYPVLLQWWTDANPMRRHLWPGIATDRIGAKRPVTDILGQISLTRARSVSSGNIHWHIKSLMENLGEVSDKLGTELYTDVAVVPAFSWLGDATKDRPQISFTSPKARWTMKDTATAYRWAIQMKRGEKWTCEIVPGAETSRLFDLADLPDAFAVTALDRIGNGSPPSLFEFKPIQKSVVAR